MRRIKRNEDKLTSTLLAVKLCDRNPRNFWNAIHKINGNKPIFSANVDNITGEQNIANFWGQRYAEIFNCLDDCSFLLTSPLSENDKSYIITPEDVQLAISSLKVDLAAGPDLLYSEHFKYAGYNLHWHLSVCFSSLLLHGKLPAQLMNILISPIIKDKKGKITKADNYRPIAKATP